MTTFTQNELDLITMIIRIFIIGAYVPIVALVLYIFKGDGYEQPRRPKRKSKRTLQHSRD